MENWFDNKVAFVTGGADGIGRASAILFARRGARVVVSDIAEEKGRETVSAIKDEGGVATFIRLDVSDRASVGAVVKEAVAHFGRLDYAFNNAGVTLGDESNWDDEIFDKTININLRGVRDCIKAQVPEMLRSGGGAIVNTASINGFISSTLLPLPAYTASKHGIVGLTKAAALEYARSNIRVNAVCPGVTETANVKRIADLSQESRTLLEGMSPMGRMARAEEMAEAVTWLCSPKASFVNAHALVVDGGFLAT